MDEINPNWKKHFFKDNRSLYEQLKSFISPEEQEEKSLNIRPNTFRIIEEIKSKKDHALNQFKQQNGYHLYISGNIQIKSFDPMNVIVCEHE